MPYPRAIYSALPTGSVVARFGVGYDGINVSLATAAGLLCTNTPDVLHQSVAELTLFLIGAAARHLLPTANAMRDGRWSPATGQELAGRTLAVIGTGKIGRAVAQMASAGFGMRVIGCTRRPAPADDLFAEVTTDFAEAVRGADYVSLHIPGTQENRQFIDARRIAAMRPDAWLINTARGAVVDERALFDALTRGTIAGAVLDVFDREPYVPAIGLRSAYAAQRDPAAACGLEHRRRESSYGRTRAGKHSPRRSGGVRRDGPVEPRSSSPPVTVRLKPGPATARHGDQT